MFLRPVSEMKAVQRTQGVCSFNIICN